MAADVTTKAGCLVAVVMLSMFVAACERPRSDLKISHTRPQGTQVDQDIGDFADDVVSATNGDLSFRVFAASALGDYTSVQERLSLGAIDMAVQPAASALERRIGLSSFPYLAETYPHAQKIYGRGGVVREAIVDLLGEQNITVLAAYPVYFGGISLNTDAVDPGNPNTRKGIKVRVPPIKSFQLMADSLGYIGSPIPFSDAFTSVQTGIVDGVIGSGAEGYYSSFRDVTQTYIRANTHFEIWYLMTNTDTFNGLEEQKRHALQVAAEAFEANRWASVQDDQSRNEDRLAESGATIVVLSDEELSEAADKVRAEVWPELVEDLGNDWAMPILEASSE